jgi:hypothetical protein
MASVFDSVQAVDPAIQTQAVADFRSTIAAIATELHSDTGAEHRSLQQWCQWLDDEGYDRDGLIHIIRQFCRRRLGDDGLAALSAFSTSIQDDADGIVVLLDRLHDQHADLSEELQDLEAACQAEQADLYQTAGGMSKGGKWGIGSATVVSVGIVAGVVWYRSKKAGEAVTERLQRDARHFECDARDMFHYGEGKSAVVANQLARDVLTKSVSYGQFVDIDKAVKAYTVDPKKVAKDLVYMLIDKRVNGLASADEQALMNKLGVDGWQPSDFGKVNDQVYVDMLKQHPDFSRYAERMIGNQARADILSKVNVPIGDNLDFKGLLNQYEPYLTKRGRAALAGDASAFENDVEIKVGTGVEDLTRQVGEQSLGELQTAEKRAADAVVTDVKDAQTSLIRKADDAVITVDEEAKAVARNGEGDL